MNNEQQQIIDEVYNNYRQENKHVMYLTFLLEDEFIRRIKHDTEFSKKWGLKVDEKELSLDERVKLFSENVNGEHLMKYADSDGLDVWNEILNKHNIPTKLITTTKITKIESYE